MTNVERVLTKIEEFAPDIVRAEKAIELLSDTLELLEEKGIHYGKEFDEVLTQAMDDVSGIRNCQLFLSPGFDAPASMKDEIAQEDFSPRSMEAAIKTMQAAILVLGMVYPEVVGASDERL